MNNAHGHPPSRPVTDAAEGDESHSDNCGIKEPENADTDAEPLPYWVEPDP